ncbi:hypothetical protein A2866_03425 [Candidatus Roizmanbacteria bacterium RIFCSPHIGHO2_01_FULL_39_8]|uniref:Uncharacterized protein n=3 Tax=Candidatus Roizmaniibacteriota TaxID=1752723 RepID=A0A1F7GUI3_9BACT|nr:MAG: hypothetical protein A2866_03425 [Candidatus Roizmanbacteria bacterium RIFCSPHIGHO2_01_FULL_39_8]OGK28089.1 MAG: hypothetical protein A3C28_03180 [Candidatus Roizmanbacteria bacterium RIFCSPHIGHO2_02_FULL_39_9]OGK36815.1 MAG: hypothetical protein A3F60_04480 [Candidatus Roizmanbacteria bacterium RIFCSPHIGHO2_12_FULL_39_8]
MRQFIIVLISFFFGFLIFFFFLKEPIELVYCRRQTEFKLYNFREAIKKNGSTQEIEENDEIKKYIQDIYQTCIK